ncbi:hypothetical protein C8F01DRAFT_1033759 [Mycena amicta]|nr:hypothetical protein C8F01DRAFT_1033759 [Mycena amicta]
MSTTATNPTASAPPSPFRRRTIGRAASPPTWACYEQIRGYGDSDEDSDEDGSASGSDEDDDGAVVSDEDSDEEGPAHGGVVVDEGMAADMEMDVVVDGDDSEAPVAAVGVAGGEGTGPEPSPPPSPVVTAKAKGKQRAVDPEPPAPKRRTRKGKRERVYTLRPILTIQRSQGFVWNQDLFVPPYIKDRYVASTSPPSNNGFVSTSVSSTNSALTDYEIEVVEIRVQEGEYDGIIP